MKYLIWAFVLATITSSCSSVQFTKRKHRKGFYSDYAFFQKKKTSDKVNVSKSFDHEVSLAQKKGANEIVKTRLLEKKNEKTGEQKTLEKETVLVGSTSEKRKDRESTTFSNSLSALNQSSSFLESRLGFKSSQLEKLKLFSYAPKRRGPLQVSFRQISLMLMVLAIGVVIAWLSISLGSSSGDWTYIAGGVLIILLAIFLAIKILLMEETSSE